ncbi:MAG: PorV/PorQ family protein [Candidatus Cloacimonetes bacterium]|nr:PorV/PorQ family protein [Candidatus Cloacimonadota bacterium]
MNNKKLIVCLIIAAISLSLLHAANEDIGTKGFNFLRLFYSARAGGMANAYTGQADDSDALFFNPAGLPQLTKMMVSTSYINYFEGFQGGSVVFAYPRRDRFAFGLYAQYLGNQGITRTLVDNLGEYLGTAGTFGATDLIVGASTGLYVHEMLNLGVGVKFIYQSIDDYSASAVAVDLALFHQTMNDHVSVGVTLRNFGKQLTYFTSSKYDEKMPTQLTVGFNYNPNEKLNANLDIVKPFEQDFFGRLGAEYQVHPMLTLRAGFNSRADDWRMGGDFDFLSGLSAGFGCYLRQYEINYSISSFGDLGLVNQVSLKYTF